MSLRLCLLDYFPTLFFRLCQENYVFVLGWGAENVAHSCPLWTGIPTPLVLGVGAKYARVTWLVTFVLVGLRRSGNFSPRSEHIRNVKDHALQALFTLRRGLRPARELLRKFRSLGFPPLLFPTLQVGRIRGGGVSGCTWCCVPRGFLPSHSTSV